MKAVILAGGLGTRISEFTHSIPKPMIEIGGNPLLWHIMQNYSKHGIKDFVICLGYKGDVIKDYFLHYSKMKSNFKINLANGQIEIFNSDCEDWNISLIDTGSNTMTGGRLLRVRSILNEETFCMTYGDGLSNVDITNLIDFHHSHGKAATVTSILQPGRFGTLEIDKFGGVSEFVEKPKSGHSRINGGFFVLNPTIFDYIGGDKTSFEAEPLVNLSKRSQLAAFNHDGFWQPCDTLSDKQKLDNLWSSGSVPWL
jgi:glucose-1-phosphate cytidylyltransferase